MHIIILLGLQHVNVLYLKITPQRTRIETMLLWTDEKM